MKREKIYILLTDTGSLLTKLIKLYTKKRYNHASISFNSKLSEVYSFGRKKVENPFRGGFVREDVKEGLFKNADCALYSIAVTKKQVKKMQDIIINMEKEKEAYRYNFLGLFGFLINKPIKRKRAFFCSQFVGHLLKEGDVTTFHPP